MTCRRVHEYSYKGNCDGIGADEECLGERGGLINSYHIVSDYGQMQKEQERQEHLH